MKEAVQAAAPPARASAPAVDAPAVETPARSLPGHRLSDFAPFPGSTRAAAAPPPEGGPGRREPAATADEEARVQPVPAQGGAPPAVDAPSGGGEAQAPAPPMLLVEDDATPDPGQMRKSAFLQELHEAVSVAADAELARAGRTSDGCPVIQRLLSHYSNESVAEVERALRLYAPEANGATTARAAVALVAARAGAVASRWVATRDLAGVPPELLTDAASGRLGGLRGLLSLARGWAGTATTLLAKTATGTAPPEVDPDVVRSRLGPGRPLESGTRAPFERAFGYDFSSVRVHVGAAPARVASEVGARAFTVGNDVAFGAGEYRPGTLAGDALVAHELAHVVQQRGADVATSRAGAAALESDADAAAVAAVASVHDPGGRFARFARTAKPRMRSGLRLQRCASNPSPCGGASLADTVKPVGDEPLSELTIPDEENPDGSKFRHFGETERDPAKPEFEACLVDDAWRFKLASLVVPVKIAVRPASYLTPVESENDPAITQATYKKVRRDLLPNVKHTFTHKNKLGTFSETVKNVSRRNQYWSRRLVIEHEEFHRDDWMKCYRPHLKAAEKQVWAYSRPGSIAATPEEALRRSKGALHNFFHPTFKLASLEYVPEKETRAYNDGAPKYQALADAVEARAQRGWPAAPPSGPPARGGTNPP